VHSALTRAGGIGAAATAGIRSLVGELIAESGDEAVASTALTEEVAA
jgi:hypothetical protein